MEPDLQETMARIEKELQGFIGSKISPATTKSVKEKIKRHVKDFINETATPFGVTILTQDNIKLPVRNLQHNLSLRADQRRLDCTISFDIDEAMLFELNTMEELLTCNVESVRKIAEAHYRGTDNIEVSFSVNGEPLDDV